MPADAANRINLALMAHVDAGKTTLTEQLLFQCGAIRKLGRVDDGTARTDSLAVERERFARLAAALDALSPLKVLGRGYAVARTEEGGILRSSAQVRPGDRIELRLAQGSLACRVEEVEGEETHGKENL